MQTFYTWTILSKITMYNIPINFPHMFIITIFRQSNLIVLIPIPNGLPYIYQPDFDPKLILAKTTQILKLSACFEREIKYNDFGDNK